MEDTVVDSSATAVANEFIARMRKKGNDAYRIGIARELFNYINTDLRDSSSKFVEQFLHAFDSRLNGVSFFAKIFLSFLKLQYLVCFIEVAGEETQQVPRYLQYLLRILPSCDEAGMKLASRAIVYIIQLSKSFAVDLVEKSLKKVVCEWLEETERVESRRLACVFLAQQLALHTPTSFFLRVPQFFKNIFKFLKDPKVNVRVASAKALRNALSVTSRREAKQKNEWYYTCYTEAMGNLADDSLSRDDRMHSALLILNELFRIGNGEAERVRIRSMGFEPVENIRTVVGSNAIDWLTEKTYLAPVDSHTARMLITEHFGEIYHECNAALSSRMPSCQAVLLDIIPRIASFQKSFAKTAPHYNSLHVNPITMYQYAVQCINKYPPAFFTIGLLFIHRPQEMKEVVGQLIGIIQNLLNTAVLKKKPIDENVFLCLKLVVRSEMAEVESQMRQFLPILFSTGLSKGLTDVAYEIMVRIPSLKIPVQEGLLKELCQLLMERKLPGKLDPPSEPFEPGGPIAVTNVPVIKLALGSLSRFSFQRHHLLMFIRYVAHGYMTCNNMEVRLAAVECCVKLLGPFVEMFDTLTNANKKQRADVLRLVQNIIRKLLSVAVVDSCVEVRLKVLKCFQKADTAFLSHLAQADMLELVYMSLHDEKLEIQKATVALLGKLAELNPAFVLPRMRKVLLETLCQLTYSRASRLEKHSAELINQIAYQSPKFMRPYMNPVLSALIPKLRIEMIHVDVTVQVLKAISELSFAGGVDLVRSREALFGSLVQFLQDSSSINRREAALQTLGRLCQNMGYVVDPYKDYPGLLDILLKLLKTEMNPSMRRSVMRVLGIIGALDPYMYKVYTGKVHSVASSRMALSLPSPSLSMDMRNDIIKWYHYEKCTLAEFYPAFTIASLMQMLDDETLLSFHRAIIQALFTIFASLGNKSVQYVDRVIPRLIEVAQGATLNPDRLFYLQQIGNLSSVIGISMKPYVDKLFTLVASAWFEDEEMKITVVDVMEKLGAAFGASFSPYVAELCPYLLKVFSCVQSIAVCLGPYINLVIPPILFILDDPGVKIEVRQLALNTVYHLSCILCMIPNAPRIIQVWLRVISVPPLQPRLLDLLVVSVKQMWRQFMVFRESVDAALAKNNLFCEEYTKLTSQLDESNSIPPPQLVANIVPQTGHFNSTTVKRPEKHRININVLRKAWAVGHQVSKEDWDQYLSFLRRMFIRQSPAPALRACAPLADVHQLLAKDLFNPAFISVWTELDESQQDEVKSCLQKALEQCNNSDLIQTILNLAEFMDHSEKGPLPIKGELLSKGAEQVRAYAKALRYTELAIKKDFVESPDPEHCRALINYANKLNVQEEAAGVLVFAEKHKLKINTQGRWYEKLNDWEKALESYREEKSESDEVYMHQMRCLEALGQWTDLNALGKKAFSLKPEVVNQERRQKMAVLAARGSWAVGDWDAMETYVEQINENNQDGSFLRAVIAIRKDRYKEAYAYIEKVRDMFDAELTAMASESYERAYGAMTLVQQLTELEEAVEYKCRPERRAHICVVWSRRLQGCRQNIEQWQRLLLVRVIFIKVCKILIENILYRTLVLSMNEMRPLWIKFASLCRRQGNLSMSRRVLNKTLGLAEGKVLHEIGFDALPIENPSLILAVCKQLWAEKRGDKACDILEKLVQKYHEAKLLMVSTDSRSPVIARQQFHQLQQVMKMNPDWNRTMAKCCLKLGQWQEAIASSTNSQVALVSGSSSGDTATSTIKRDDILKGFLAVARSSFSTEEIKQEALSQQSKSTPMENFTKATSYDPTWYKAWHKLASTYFNLAMYPAKSEVRPQLANVPVITSFQQTAPYQLNLSGKKYNYNVDAGLSQPAMKAQMSQLNTHNPQIPGRHNAQISAHLVNELQGGQALLSHQPMQIPPRMNYDSQAVPPHLDHQGLQMTQHLGHELQRVQQQHSTQHGQRMPHPAMQLSQHRNATEPAQGLGHFNPPFGHVMQHVNPDVTQALAQVNMQSGQIPSHINYPGVNLQHMNPEPVPAQSRLNMQGNCLPPLSVNVPQAGRTAVPLTQVTETAVAGVLPGPSALNPLVNQTAPSQVSNPPLQPNPEITAGIAPINLDAVQMRHLSKENTQMPQLIPPGNIENAQQLPYISEVPQPLQQTDAEVPPTLPSLAQIPPNVSADFSQMNPGVSVLPHISAEPMLNAPQRLSSRFCPQPVNRVQQQAIHHNSSQLSSHISCRIPSRNTSAVLGSQMSPMMGPQLSSSNIHVVSYAVQAIKCFVKAITLAEGSKLEDTLRFLTLWFKHGDHIEVFEQIRESLRCLPVEMWLEVTPQLMARLHSDQNVAQLIKQVVIDLSKAHPQSLIYALTVAANSTNKRRSTLAKEVLSIMNETWPKLVEEAKLVSEELIRCAILWHELWHEALDDASRLYFQEKDIAGMFELLDPLHAQLEKGATTLKEQSFKQTYDNDLKEAWSNCRRYLHSKNSKELNQAWELYYNVFRKISAQLRQLTSLDLSYVSPKLMKAQNLELAVPGTYDPNGTIVRIASVGNHLQVISSKQRPRKVTIKGSDGKDYAFLLKGHEDPRQDERVMQLFGLVNTLLLHRTDTGRQNLTIQRYSIVALSQNSGLIGWVPNCDTLHSLIRDYREKNNILLSMEHKLMQTFATDIDQLTLLQKVQVFEHALDLTDGKDLQHILWLKSPNSEVWFDRRTNYTRSMACMSMVGYILGLGDRHPSNLMLDRVSGKIVHIDFGDCFEVAMTREKFPEKIPFRLTRMLIQAMEVTGIEGNYRITCERVLQLLRANKESLLAVLEAFVYDPLINWRLLNTAGAVASKRAPPESQRGDKQSETKAEASLKRIRHKLSGRDFQPNVEYSVSEQVNRLIHQATLSENLCQCFIGWCPFW
uniref:Serine/threonine-protein kinase TOR n=1 Tax=Syphacia muris TaxID=451379 RepID=A0A158R4T6_9BILA